MNIVLTGATGFLGSVLARKLVAKGIQVFAITRTTSQTRRIDELRENPLFKTVTKEELAKTFEKNPIDAVIHVATCLGRNGESPEEIEEANIRFPLSLLDLAIAHGVDLFINTDTFLEKADSLDKNHQYLKTKKAFLAEALARSLASTHFANVKIYQMYGPDDNPTKFIPFLIKEFLSNKPRIPLNPGLQERDYVYVDDVAESYLAILSHRNALSPKEHFDIGNGKVFTLKAVVELIQSLTTSTSVPGFGDLAYGSSETMYAIADTTNNKKIHWEARMSLEEGLQKTVAFYKKAV